MNIGQKIALLKSQGVSIEKMLPVIFTRQNDVYFLSKIVNDESGEPVEPVITYLTYKTYDGDSTLKVVECVNGTPQESAPTAPDRDSTAQYTFAFVGWNTKQDQQTAESGSTTKIKTDRTVYAAYSQTTRTYTITWKNSDESVLRTDQNIPYGTIPTWGDVEPTYDGETSIGWYPEISFVTGNATYTATYPEKVTTYLTYKSYDGSSTIKTVTCLNGIPQETAPSSPSRSSTAQYNYTFIGWNSSQDQQNAEFTSNGPTNGINVDTILYAAYSWTVRTYTITWKNSDNTILETDTNVPYGSTPSYDSSSPHNPVTGDLFSGWSPTVTTVTGDATYTATYIQYYTVYFYNGSTLLETVQNVPYGGSATYTGSTPVSSTDSSLAFEGWSPPPTNIQGNTSCYAQFESAFEDAEITDDWDTIITNINSGTATYKIGNYKSLDLGSEGVVKMQIVGKNKDPLSVGGGNAATSWISKETLMTSHKMNPSRTVDPEDSTKYVIGTGGCGGWKNSEMKTYLNETIKPLIPSNVRSAIKTVIKYSASYDVSGTLIDNDPSSDDVWIPAARELNSSYYNRELSAPVYGNVYSSKTDRKKYKADYSNYTIYWTRTCASSDEFVSINGSSGSSSNLSSSNTRSIALGFCI